MRFLVHCHPYHKARNNSPLSRIVASFRLLFLLNYSNNNPYVATIKGNNLTCGYLWFIGSIVDCTDMKQQYADMKQQYTGMKQQ